MDRSKEVKTTFRRKRADMVDSLKDMLFDAQQALETECEEALPVRPRTIVFLVDKDDSLVEVLTAAADEHSCQLEPVHNEFDLFHEVGKNSIVAIIVQVGQSKQPNSTIASLKKRNIPTFVVCKKECPELDLWLKAYGDYYKWPDEVGRLVHDIKPLCDC